ncbi:SPOR domain-containing protein [Novosphingobium rhizovicinum]|uniref:SPOR domain-containing protein n=1 Tax=Novosphingobium rhizovicinum TaxID=3228928 RepID=A0ABV3R8F7_9SPHN
MFYSVRGMMASIMAAAVLAGTPGAAVADVKQGVDAWAAGDFEAAVREWQGPAAAGDPDAQFNLAQAHKLGRGVPRDLAKAEALYAAAAARGHLQASDSYGLLLFQRGEREKAMPYIRSAAGRGDARAQYIHGLALFNGDGVEKDWVRAYAYVSLAQQAGLPQATTALSQMDQHIPMAERQKAVSLAGQIAAETEANRARQLAAFDLGSPSAGVAANPPPTQARTPSVAAVERAATDAERAAGAANRTSPRIAAIAPTDEAAVPPSHRTNPAETSAQTPAQRSRTEQHQPAKPAVERAGPWRVQLGAFGVRSNADALWERAKGRPELAGHPKKLVTSGKLTKLQAVGFASESAATAACGKLKRAGFACLATRD